MKKQTKRNIRTIFAKMHYSKFYCYDRIAFADEVSPQESSKTVSLPFHPVSINCAVF